MVGRPEGINVEFSKEQGGLSGRPLHNKSTAVIRNFYRLTEGKLPIIGVGGISSAKDAYEKIRAGASLVQLYTGLLYQGPGLVKKINEGLLFYLQRDGFTKIIEAVGVDAKMGTARPKPPRAKKVF